MFASSTQEKISVTLSRGETLYALAPFMGELAENRVGNSKGPSSWVEPARAILGPAAEALVVCGSREEAWLAIAVAKELGPFDRILASRSKNGNTIKSWSTQLIRTAPNATIQLQLQCPILPFHRLGKGKHRGEPPVADMIVSVNPRFPLWAEAIRNYQFVGSLAQRHRVLPAVRNSIVIEYDGGGHRKTPIEDKIRDLNVFHSARMATLRVTNDGLKRTGDWKQFRAAASTIASWLEPQIESARDIDTVCASLIEQNRRFSEDALSIKVLASHARSLIMSGDRDGAIAILNRISDSILDLHFADDGDIVRYLKKLGDTTSLSASKQANKTILEGRVGAA